MNHPLIIFQYGYLLIETLDQDLIKKQDICHYFLDRNPHVN